MLPKDRNPFIHNQVVNNQQNIINRTIPEYPNQYINPNHMNQPFHQSSHLQNNPVNQQHQFQQIPHFDNVEHNQSHFNHKPAISNFEKL
jgi:hypothetical protein